MKLYLISLIVFALTGCAAMQSAVDDTMEGVEQDAEKIGNTTQSISGDVTESLNPARDVNLVLSPELTAAASMEVRNLQKTSDWNNIAEIYAMGLEDYTGNVTAILFNNRGTQLEKVELPVTITKDEVEMIKVTFSEGTSIKKYYMIKLSTGS